MAGGEAVVGGVAPVGLGAHPQLDVVVLHHDFEDGIRCRDRARGVHENLELPVLTGVAGVVDEECPRLVEQNHDRVRVGRLAQGEAAGRRYVDVEPLDRHEVVLGAAVLARSHRPDLERVADVHLDEEPVAFGGGEAVAGRVAPVGLGAHPQLDLVVLHHDLVDGIDDGERDPAGLHDDLELPVLTGVARVVDREIPLLVKEDHHRVRVRGFPEGEAAGGRDIDAEALNRHEVVLRTAVLARAHRPDRERVADAHRDEEPVAFGGGEAVARGVAPVGLGAHAQLDLVVLHHDLVDGEHDRRPDFRSALLHHDLRQTVRAGVPVVVDHVTAGGAGDDVDGLLGVPGGELDVDAQAGHGQPVGDGGPGRARAERADPDGVTRLDSHQDAGPRPGGDPFLGVVAPEALGSHAQFELPVLHDELGDLEHRAVGGRLAPLGDGQERGERCRCGGGGPGGRGCWAGESGHRRRFGRGGRRRICATRTDDERDHGREDNQEESAVHYDAPQGP